MRAYLNGIGQPYDFDAYRSIPNNSGRLLETNVGKSRLLMHWEPQLHELMHVASDGWYFDPYSWIFTSDNFAPTMLYVYRVPIDNGLDCCRHSNQPATLQRYEPNTKTFMPRFVPFHRGGAVIVVVVNEDYNVQIGTSVCSSVDIFDFKSGAQMAYDRAVNNQSSPSIQNRTLREAVWQIAQHFNALSYEWLLEDLSDSLDARWLAARS